MNSFFLLFIGIPTLEIFLMIKIGSKVGALNTVALVFLTAIIIAAVIGSNQCTNYVYGV